MARVVPQQVVQILGFSGNDADVDVRPFIDVANTIVTEELQGKELSSQRMKLVELYLAAHFAQLSIVGGDRRLVKIGDATEMYDFGEVSGEGLSATRFGRQAIALDTTGSLGTMAARPVKAVFRVV